MRDLFVTMVVFGSLPLILYRPYVGIVMWAWISYMSPHRMSWGFAADFPFAMIIAAATMVGMVFAKDVQRIPWTRETIVLVLFIIWMGVTTLFALHPDLVQAHFVQILKIQLMTFITIMLMSDRHRINLLVWAIVISLGFFGVKGGVFTVLTGGGYHVMGPPGTFIGGNNEIGLALIMSIPLMRYLQMQATQAWVRHGLTAAMMLTLIAILGTQSRGALLGLLAMVAFLVWKSQKRLILLVSLAAVLALGFTFMPKHWHERMHSIVNYEHDSSAMGRVNAWKFATNLALAHPITGGGFDSFRQDLFAKYAPDPENVHDAHSIYFEVLGEHGFIGLVLFIMLGSFAWQSCAVLIKQAEQHEETRWIGSLSRMVQVSLVGFLVSGAFLSLAYFDFYYHLVAIIVVMKTQMAAFSAKSQTAAAVAIAPASSIPRS